MSPSARRIVIFGTIGTIGLVGLVVLAAVTALLIVDPRSYKARLETAASRALGMKVSIAGRIAFDLFPRTRIRLDDVHVRGDGSEIVSAQRATVDIDLLSVLGGEVRVKRIALARPLMLIERDSGGRFNFEHRPPVEASAAMDWPDISFSDGNITYADIRFGNAFEAGNCGGEAHDVRHAGGQGMAGLTKLSFTAQLRCADVRKDGLTLTDLTFKADVKNGISELKPLTARILGTQGSGSLRVDLSGPVPSYEIVYSLPQFPVEEFFKAAHLKPIAGGRMDFSTHLSAQGTTLKDLRQSLQGSISLRGAGLVFSGGDLDRQFAEYESSQNFDLVDLGAVFFAGPLGLLVTKGYDVAAVSQGARGSSNIHRLVSDWTVAHGVAQANDVALATNRNRIALHGGVDFVNDRFNDVTLAVVDARGCVKVRQKIHGPLRAPVVERPNLINSLAGPALNLLKKGGDLLLGERCDVFYAGSVAAPK